MESRWFCGPASNGGLYYSHAELSIEPILMLTPSQMDAGWAILEGLGLSKTRPLACIHVRDGAYLPKLAYHDYRDPPLETYEQLARNLLKQGFSVVRTGSVAKQRMCIESPDFLDYPFSSSRSEFMDVFLYAACQLTVAGSGSGIDYMAASMRKPIVWCDLRPLSPPTYPDHLSLFIFSGLRWTESGVSLTLDEILKYQFSMTEQFRESGLEFIPNTAIEVIEAVDELWLRINGLWDSSSDNELLHERFWRVFVERVEPLVAPDAHLMRPRHILPRLGSQFLDRHRVPLAVEISPYGSPGFDG